MTVSRGLTPTSSTKNPLLRSTGALPSHAHSRVRRHSHHCFCYVRYQVTQSYRCACENTPARRSSSLPPWLTSNAHPRPKAAHTAPAKPKEKHLTELPQDSLLLDTDLAHSCYFRPPVVTYLAQVTSGAHIPASCIAWHLQN